MKFGTEAIFSIILIFLGIAGGIAGAWHLGHFRYQVEKIEIRKTAWQKSGRATGTQKVRMVPVINATRPSSAPTKLGDRNQHRVHIAGSAACDWTSLADFNKKRQEQHGKNTPA